MIRKAFSPARLCPFFLSVYFLFVFTLSLQAQELPGYNYNNYAGAYGLADNPANAASSRYAFHFALFGLSVNAGNNGYQFSKSKLMSFQFNNLTEGVDYFKLDDGKPKSFWLNAAVLGPSFLIRLNKISGLGFFTRVRALGNEDNLSNSVFNLLGESNANYYNQDFIEHNLRAGFHSFGEGGLTYGRVLWQDGTHVLQAGITLKYLVGIAAGRLFSNNLRVNLQSDTVINKLDGDGSLQYSGNGDLKSGNNGGNNSFFKNLGGGNGNSSIGLDLGVAYEWRPEGSAGGSGGKHTIPYKIRLALSVTDIGAIRYHSSTGGAYNIDADGQTASTLNPQNGESLPQFIDRLKGMGILTGNTDTTGTFKAALPTAARFNLDWHLARKFFLNFYGLINLLSLSNQANMANYTSTFFVTPRMETRMLSIASPFSYNSHDQFNWGFSIKAGPLLLGSSSLLSNLVKQRIGNTDVYMGLSIGFGK